MSESKDKQYWKSWDTRPGAHREQGGRHTASSEPDFSQFSRRGFLETTGFALFASALAGCSRQPAMNALAPVEQPSGIVFGKANHYASVCQGCSAACGTLVKCRDGRPIKLEGNPDHPLSTGGLCAVGQASILGLYDSHRLQDPLIDGEIAGWERVDEEIRAALERIHQQGGEVRFVTGSELGPTEGALIRTFLEGFADANHVVYDPLSNSAILSAHEATHGVAVLPHYRLEQADVIVSFDADFLGTWIAPVEFTRGYQSRRTPQGDPPQMSYHVQFESRMSLTGSNADRRVCVRPEELPLVMSHLAVRLARRADRFLDAAEMAECSVPGEWLDELAERLWGARGKSLVLCGSQERNAQVLCNLLNELLDAYGRTLDIQRPSNQRRGRDGELTQLVQELHDGKVAALFVAGVNPLAELPESDALRKAIARVPLVVSLANHLDETATAAKYVCPVGDPLETWSDVEPVAGVVSVRQPVIQPLGRTRSLLASVAMWAKQPDTDYELVRRHWQKAIYPRSSSPEPFATFWNRALHDGYAKVEPDAVAVGSFNFAAVQLTKEAPSVPAQLLTLVLYPKVGMLDGRHAFNPWLQELPDPVTKVTWDNYACLSPAAAARLDVGEGDVVRVAASEAPSAAANLELPVVIQPGQHDGVIAVALGYGRQGTERFANIGPQWLEGRPSVGPNGLVGVNAAPLLRFTPAGLRYERSGVVISKTGQKRRLASTQQHHEITVPKHLATPGTERRPVVEETTLAAYQRDHHAGSHAHHDLSADMWPDDHPYRGHRWGMVIDLNKCTGCSGCVIACQAENNIPVVGQDEVRRSREMHWLRIDRYYAQGPDGSIDVLHQPMMCQHCDNAPCETVCPVLATVHSEEGLNQQVYNRCVGTRYCANNCPYKVRRFNWFEYARDDGLQNGVLNPDITVRTRGVMEKCSFCVQRIGEAKIEAKREGRPLADGDIQPACQQSCPAGAIVFGDLNDPESAAAKLLAEPRAYRVLEEINVRPSVGYLRLVRHRESSEEEHDHV